MASSMLLTDESTPICPNTQLTNIGGIDTSVTIDIMLPTTTADVLEEVSECPENESVHVSNKNHDICSNGDIDYDVQYLRLKENTITLTYHLLLNTKITYNKSEKITGKLVYVSKKLVPLGKEYFCFQTDGKSACAAQFAI